MLVMALMIALGETQFLGIEEYELTSFFKLSCFELVSFLIQITECIFHVNKLVVNVVMCATQCVSHSTHRNFYI